MSLGKDPVLKRKASDVTPDTRPTTDFSWLGKFADCGWSIRIEPRLSDAQWDVYGRRANECWDATAFSYSPTRTLELLHELFPTHELRLTWPKCTYRIWMPRRGQTPLYVTCGAQAHHTEVRVEDVTGVRVGIARCEQHRGQL